MENKPNIIIIGGFCCKKTSIAQIIKDYLNKDKDYQTKDKDYQTKDKDDQTKENLNNEYHYMSLFERIKNIIIILHQDESDINLILHLYKSLLKYEKTIWCTAIFSSLLSNKSYIFDDIYSAEEFNKINSIRNNNNIIIKIQMSDKTKQKIYPNRVKINKNIKKSMKFIDKIKADLVYDLDYISQIPNSEIFEQHIITKFNDYIEDHKINWNEFIKNSSKVFIKKIY